MLDRTPRQNRPTLLGSVKPSIVISRTVAWKASPTCPRRESVERKASVVEVEKGGMREVEREVERGHTFSVSS